MKAAKFAWLVFAALAMVAIPAIHSGIHSVTVRQTLADISNPPYPPALNQTLADISNPPYPPAQALVASA